MLTWHTSTLPLLPLKHFNSKSWRSSNLYYFDWRTTRKFRVNNISTKLKASHTTPLSYIVLPSLTTELSVCLSRPADASKINEPHSQLNFCLLCSKLNPLVYRRRLLLYKYRNQVARCVSVVLHQTKGNKKRLKNFLV